jgi:hypothetical protein
MRPLIWLSSDSTLRTASGQGPNVPPMARLTTSQSHLRDVRPTRRLVPNAERAPRRGHLSEEHVGFGTGQVAFTSTRVAIFGNTSDSGAACCRCPMPSSDRISITAAAPKATHAPMNMICPICQNP